MTRSDRFVDDGRGPRAAFVTIQTPYNLLNPSAGMNVPAGFQEADYGNVIGECVRSL